MKSVAIICGFAALVLLVLGAVTCTGKAPPMNPLPSASSTSSATPVSSEPVSSSAPPGNLPLRSVRDIPLSGGATRFDYQSLDSTTARLYIAHLGDSTMTVFDTTKEVIVANVTNLPRVHGVLAVPELHRVYASATGSNELAVIDDSSFQVIARAPAGDYPDGIAYASKVNKIYVSDLHGKTDTVIDAKTNERVTTIALGGGAGNTQYDPL